MTASSAGQPKASDSKPEAKPESQPEARAEPKAGPLSHVRAEPVPEPEAEPATKVESKPEAQAPPDVTPSLVKRVHELYEQLGREDVRAVQDWEEAQREIQHGKPEPKPHK